MFPYIKEYGYYDPGLVASDDYVRLTACYKHEDRKATLDGETCLFPAVKVFSPYSEGVWPGAHDDYVGAAGLTEFYGTRGTDFVRYVPRTGPDVINIGEGVIEMGPTYPRPEEVYRELKKRYEKADFAEQEMHEDALTAYNKYLKDEDTTYVDFVEYLGKNYKLIKI